MRIDDIKVGDEYTYAVAVRGIRPARLRAAAVEPGPAGRRQVRVDELDYATGEVIPRGEPTGRNAATSRTGSHLPARDLTPFTPTRVTYEAFRAEAAEFDVIVRRLDVALAAHGIRADRIRPTDGGAAIRMTNDNLRLLIEALD